MSEQQFHLVNDTHSQFQPQINVFRSVILFVMFIKICEMIFEKYELLVCDCFYDVLAICGKEEKLSGTTSLTVGSIAYFFNILHNLKGLMDIRQPISLQYIRKKLRTKKCKPTSQQNKTKNSSACIL